MSLLIVSCSLNPESKSREMAKLLRRHYVHETYPCEFVDLADYALPHCDGEAAYNHPTTKVLLEKTTKAEAVIMALPIYNFGVSAAAKTFIELAGTGLEGKIIGFICSAGGVRSYMSVMSLANSLMLDFRCLIIPKFVYLNVNEESFDNPDIHTRLHELLKTVVALKDAWKETNK